MRNRLFATALAILSAPPLLAGDVVLPDGILSRAGDVAYGAYLAGECVTCHQADGSDDGIPALNGLDRAHFITAIFAYKQKVRENTAMQQVAGRLSEDEVAALAAYFEGLD